MASMSKSKVKEDRIRGALYGFAIGDAMGATTEFMTNEEIKRKYGCLEDIIGGGWLDLKAGDITDDTQMSICIMDALQKSIEVGSGEDYFHKLVGANFVEWLGRGPKDVGSQCARGINYYIRNGKQRNAEPSELGNGGLMRALPCALVGKLDLNLVQNSFTHHNEMCMSAVRAYHNIIRWALVEDNVCRESIDRAFGKKLLHRRPTGYVIDTLDNAMYWCYIAEDAADAIVKAVNDGGDADTIGALTGGIAGAMYGYNSIPTIWIEKLNPEIKKYLDKFSNFCCQI